MDFNYFYLLFNLIFLFFRITCKFDEVLTTDIFFSTFKPNLFVKKRSLKNALRSLWEEGKNSGSHELNTDRNKKKTHDFGEDPGAGRTQRL